MKFELEISGFETTPEDDSEALLEQLIASALHTHEISYNGLVGVEKVGETNQSTEEKPVLDPGDTVTDMHAPDFNERGNVHVIEQTTVRADEYEIEGHRTVADENPHFPDHDPVVKGKYLGQGEKPTGKSYAFPRSRLRK